MNSRWFSFPSFHRYNAVVSSCFYFITKITESTPIFLSFSLIVIANISIRLQNGIPSCANKDAMQTIARESWGFQGYITSDWYTREE